VPNEEPKKVSMQNPAIRFRGSDEDVREPRGDSIMKLFDLVDVFAQKPFIIE
jgi:hypothetical protein